MNSPCYTIDAKEIEALFIFPQRTVIYGNAHFLRKNWRNVNDSFLSGEVMTRKGNYIDLTGMRVGKLVVIKPVEKDNLGKLRWLCQCDCGNKKVIGGNCLRRGVTNSCGCLMGGVSTHKRTGTPIYLVWKGMIQRCTNPNSSRWKDYGGRGIVIDSTWYEFENFLKDMGERPEGYTLDRINNDGNYEKSNCHWADRKDQMNNKRNNCFLTYNNKTQTFAEWGREVGLTSSIISKRIKKGWTVERALSTPARIKRANGTRNRRK